MLGKLVIVNLQKTDLDKHADLRYVHIQQIRLIEIEIDIDFVLLSYLSIYI